MLDINTTPVRLCDVDPKKNPAFSPNLYRWLRKSRTMRLLADRYVSEGVEYLGFLDDGGYFIGSKLMGVLCNGSAEQKWSFPGVGTTAVHRPLWADYLRVGRCAIDPSHEMCFLDDRYSLNESGRTCLWCGCSQRRETYTVKETRERWVSLSAEKPQRSR